MSADSSADAVGPSKYDRLIAAAKAMPRSRRSSCIPATRARCAAPSRARRGRHHPADPGRAGRRRSGTRPPSIGLDIAGFEIVDAPHSEAAAAKAVELIHAGKGEMLMKGSLHTDELMRAVTAKAGGLRTDRRISHVFVMDVPAYAETMFVTDAAINIFPDLDAKRDIIQNAIDLYNAGRLRHDRRGWRSCRRSRP